MILWSQYERKSRICEVASLSLKRVRKINNENIYIMHVMNSLSALLKGALSGTVCLAEKLSDDEWYYLYRMSVKQAVVGVVFCGIQSLPRELMPPKKLLMEWLTASMAIRKRNELLYYRSSQMCEHFVKKGHLCCVLKGQGNALMYKDKYCRTPGDIDLWLDGGRRKIVNDVKQRFPNAEMSWQHILYPIFSDVEVEVHYFPSFMLNFLSNNNLQFFFKQEKQSNITNKVYLPNGEGDLFVPKPYFNAVYQLTHIFRHYLTEGIGLRQFVDYYYVMKNLKSDEREYVISTFKKVGIYKFARAVMYVETKMLGLGNEYLVVSPDKKRGEQLLKEIASGGNFGKYGKLSWSRSSNFWNRQFLRFRRNFLFLFNYPGEVIGEPIFRAYYYFWRRKNKVAASST